MDNQVKAYTILKDRDVDQAVKLLFENTSTYMKLDIHFALSLPCAKRCFVVVFELINENWVKCGRTEIIEPDQNNFIQAVPIVYYFERNQEFHIMVCLNS